MTVTSEVIIVGGGAIGAACARELAQAGREVLVLDRSESEGAAWKAAAGMLSPQIEAGPDDPLFDFSMAAREKYPTLAHTLRETTGIDIGFWQGGILRLAADDSEATALRARVEWQRSRGHTAEFLGADAVHSRWSGLGPNRGALWAANEAALDPGALVEALLKDAALAGARVRSERVRGIEVEGDRVVAVLGESGRFACDQVVLAAGAWGPTLSGLPRALPIVPLRGQMVAFPWPRELERRIVYGKEGYVVARGQEAVAGSTMELAGFDARVTPAGVAGIMREATAICPALSRQEPSRTWAGLRPVTPDGIPIVGADPSARGLWHATGHGRNGILLAAITGILVTQLMNGLPPETNPDPLKPDRFPG